MAIYWADPPEKSPMSKKRDIWLLSKEQPVTKRPAPTWGIDAVPAASIGHCPQDQPLSTSSL